MTIKKKTVSPVLKNFAVLDDMTVMRSKAVRDNFCQNFLRFYEKIKQFLTTHHSHHPVQYFQIEKRNEILRLCDFVLIFKKIKINKKNKKKCALRDSNPQPLECEPERVGQLGY